MGNNSINQSTKGDQKTIPNSLIDRNTAVNGRLELKPYPLSQEDEWLEDKEIIQREYWGEEFVDESDFLNAVPDPILVETQYMNESGIRFDSQTMRSRYSRRTEGTKYRGYKKPGLNSLMKKDRNLGFTTYRKYLFADERSTNITSNPSRASKQGSIKLCNYNKFSPAKMYSGSKRTIYNDKFFSGSKQRPISNPLFGNKTIKFGSGKRLNNHNQLNNPYLDTNLLKKQR